MKFFGILFGPEGITPDPEKVTALNAMIPPTNVTELRSFLGMTNYSAPFIPDYANVTGPLRHLICKGATFIWTKERQQAFQILQKELKQQTTMAYFDPAKDTKLIVDGSRKDGVASILAQKSSTDEEYHPIRYDSRATTTTEQNYSRLEIKSLPLLFGTLKNHIYHYGLPQYIASTDHQPLVPLYQ